MKSIEEKRKATSTSQLNDYFNRMAIKGFITCFAVSWFQQATGISTFATYASLIFQISDSVVSVDASIIILATINIFGGLLSTQLSDAFSRKTTIIASLFGTTFGLFTFSTYLYLHHYDYDVSKFLWLPVVCLSSIMFVASTGFLALANTIVVENFPPKVKLLLINVTEGSIS